MGRYFVAGVAAIAAVAAIWTFTSNGAGALPPGVSNETTASIPASAPSTSRTSPDGGMDGHVSIGDWVPPTGINP